MPRLFFGVEVPPEIKDRLLKVRSAVPGARWQSAEQLHITLLFLGSVEEARIGDVARSACEVHSESVELEVAGLGCFGHPQRPRNLWAGVRPTEPVAAIHEVLGRRMEDLGFTAERRAFLPHITLARFKRQPGSVESLLSEYGESVFGQFAVTQFALFGSKQGPTGSVYTVLERFSLRNDG